VTDSAIQTPLSQISSSRADSAAAQGSGPWLRPPSKGDGARIHQLVADCPPLDLNSLYTYLLWSEYFPDTSVLAGEGDQLQGYISGFLPPERSDTLFVWQVAVHASARGKGLGGKMLLNLLQRPALAGVRYLETTVGPDNLASRGMFNGLARRLNAKVHETPLFDRTMFGAQGHDDEPLLRIGPFKVL